MGVLPRQHPGGQQRLHVLLLLEDRILHPLVHPAALTEEHHRVRRQVVDPGGDSRIDGCQIPVRRPRGRAAAQPLRVLPQRLDDGLRLLLFSPASPPGRSAGPQAGQPLGGRSGAAPPPPAGSGRRRRFRVRRWVPGSKAPMESISSSKNSHRTGWSIRGRTRPECRPAGRTGPRPPPARTGYTRRRAVAPPARPALPAPPPPG